jgi:heme exporter protein D
MIDAIHGLTAVVAILMSLVAGLLVVVFTGVMVIRNVLAEIRDELKRRGR